MKQTLLLAVMVLIATLTFGQRKLQDVVYLKNGSIVRGMLVEVIPEKSVKIETADGSLFVYKTEEVVKIRKESPQKKRGVNYSTKQTDSNCKYKGIVEIGYQFGVGEYGINRIKMNVINGIQLSDIYSVGFGVGFRNFHEESTTFIPLFIDFRGEYKYYNLSPYFAVDLGYSLNASNDCKGAGFMFSPSVGVGFPVSEKLTMSVGLSYELQIADYYRGYGSRYYTSRENIGGLGLSIGLSF
ncbi:hypothetical protein EMN47_15765 [Prolixibacteraceae bacterium JC049]|nr:hypothetical protein [Prolixibacteraceae bacterium JC049]